MYETRKRKGIMLCYPYEERRLTGSRLGWTDTDLVYIQPKLDGERCLAVIDFNTVTLLSSTGLEIPFLSHIKRELLNRFSGSCIVLDGELYRHDVDFELIHGMVSRTVTPHEDERMLQYHIFDIKQQGTFNRRESVKNHLLYFTTETSILQNVRSNLFMKSADIINEEIVKATKKGFEGIIIRHPLAPYVEKRSTKVMKFKPKAFDSYTITRIIEAIDKHGKPKGIAGAYEVSSGDTLFEVGSTTFTEEEKREHWENRDALTGRILNVSYQSKNSNGKPKFCIGLSILAGQNVTTGGGE